MAERERDEHDISTAMNRVTTVFGIDWRYVVFPVLSWLMLTPNLDEYLHLRGVWLWSASGLLLSGFLSLGIRFGRDPARLPMRLISLGRKRDYSPLKRRVS